MARNLCSATVIISNHQILQYGSGNTAWWWVVVMVEKGYLTAIVLRKCCSRRGGVVTVGATKLMKHVASNSACFAAGLVLAVNGAILRGNIIIDTLLMIQLILHA